MRRFFSILTGLFLLASIQGQVVSSSVWFAPASAGGLGPEKLSNGALTSGTDWDDDGEFVLTNDEAQFPDGGVFSYVWQLSGDMVSSVETNTDYTLTFVVSDCSGTMLLQFMETSSSISYISETTYANGTHELEFTSPADIGSGGLSIRTQVGGDAGNIDDISLKERL